jgi:hypothetical protein
METFNMYLLYYTFWTLLVTGHAGGPLTRWRWQDLTLYAVDFFTIFVVQCYFCYRVWRVSANVIITSIIAIAAMFQVGAGMAFMANSIRHRSPQEIFNAEGHRTARMELISSMICDLAISTSLVYYFYTFRISTKKMDAVLQQLIIVSVNMGVLLCLVTATNLALFEVGSFLSLPPHIILIKLYVNSLLATLNTRKYIREIANKTVEITLPTWGVDALPPFDVDSKSSRSS